MNSLKNNKAREGFTFIETLVSLTVITIICVMLSFCYSSSIKVIIKTPVQTNFDLELMEFDSSLRKLINSVSLPEWKKDYNFKYTSSSLSLEYIKGFSESQETKMNQNIKIISCSVIYYDKEKPAGLTIEYLYNDIKYTCSELFSSIPFGQVELWKKIK